MAFVTCQPLILSFYVFPGNFQAQKACRSRFLACYVHYQFDRRTNLHRYWPCRIIANFNLNALCNSTKIKSIMHTMSLHGLMYSSTTHNMALSPSLSRFDFESGDSQPSGTKLCVTDCKYLKSAKKDFPIMP